jgi:cell division protein FtsN
MGYQFSFTKTRLLLLVLTCLLAGILIFAGGVVTGKRMAPSDGEELSSKSEPALNAKQLALAKSGVKLPAVPAIVAGQAALTKAATPANGPATTQPAPSQPTVGESATAPPPTPAAAAEPAPAAGPTVPVAVAVGAANPADRPFVLQVGAFRDTKPAKDLQADLLKKGYATTIYNMVDEDLRSWHMVRFGGYKDISTASKAASDFTGKEGIQALVKRFDAL